MELEEREQKKKLDEKYSHKKLVKIYLIVRTWFLYWQVVCWQNDVEPH